MEDLHICGVCKSFFSDLKQFTEHKLICSVSQNAQTITPNNTEELLEKETISSERALDLAILESGTFPFVLQCDNEEVISETTEIEINDEPTNKAELENIINTNNIINQIDEEDVAALLVNELSIEVINNCPNESVPRRKKGKSRKKLPRKDCNSEKSEYVSKVVHQRIKPKNTRKSKVTSLESKKKNICNVCNFQTTFPKDLVRHMRMHTGERPFECVVCDKRFARQDKLAEHKRIHFADKRYKCQLCEYACTNGGSLRRHIQTHTDERPHRCQICLYRARSASHLVTHLRTHTGDSPFFCLVENCRYAFKTSSDLKRHMSNHKHKFPSDHESAEKVSCKSCLEEKKTLNRHLSCPGCQNVKFSGTRRGRGKRKKQGGRVRCEKKYPCPHCQAAFVREDSLRSHLRLHPQSQMSPSVSPDKGQQESAKEGNRSPDLFGSTEASEAGLTQLYTEGADSLELSFIPLKQDIIVQSIMDTSFL